MIIWASTGMGPSYYLKPNSFFIFNHINYYLIPLIKHLLKYNVGTYFELRQQHVNGPHKATMIISKKWLEICHVNLPDRGDHAWNPRYIVEAFLKKKWNDKTRNKINKQVYY